MEINTKISVGEIYGRNGIANLTLEDARFFGRPNFSGEEDRFKDSRRKFTVLIPNDVADQLRELGWNVKTTIPTPEEVAEGREPISHLKVMVDDNADIFIIAGEDREKLTPPTFGLLDRSRIEALDMEIRGWNYNAEDVVNQGVKPEYSARLVMLVANIRPNILGAKYGRLL